MKLVVDRDRCTGLGMCEAAAPEYFEIQDDGSLQLLAEHVDPGRLAEIEAAVASCPAEALKIVEG
jgi:ferredoxin